MQLAEKAESTKIGLTKKLLHKLIS